MGTVTSAAKQCGISRSTHYQWMKSKKYAAQVRELAEVALDFAESKLLKNISNGDTTAIIFYLRTKGKHRGYTERTEVVANLNLRPCIIDWTKTNPTIASSTEPSAS
jgi:Helix-turn-helix of insertion element transposase